MTDVQHLLDKSALRDLAENYAKGADRRDKALWSAVLAEDCVIEGPGFSIEGREANLHSIDFLGRNFVSTLHRVHNQTVEISGDSASGETYCTASHRIAGDGGDTILDWHIRYQDQFRREAGGWRFTRRALVVDWEEVRPLVAPDHSAQS